MTHAEMTTIEARMSRLSIDNIERKRHPLHEAETIVCLHVQVTRDNIEREGITVMLGSRWPNENPMHHKSTGLDSKHEEHGKCLRQDIHIGHAHNQPKHSYEDVAIKDNSPGPYYGVGSY
jgi:hypothetical protein